jgi:hypothetical protein
MSELGPTLGLNVSGEEITIHRANTALYTFAGEISFYSHVFVAKEIVEGRTKGIFIFCDSEAYEPIEEFIKDNDFQMHLNLTDVLACDREAYLKQASADVNTDRSFPATWVTEDGEL